jgi:hypothetical protein
VTSEEEVAEYRASLAELVAAARHWVRTNLRPAELARFNNTSGILPMSLKTDFNETHRDLRNTADRVCDNLEQLMDDYRY